MDGDGGDSPDRISNLDGDGGDSPDRISNLPEPMLQHILCFLDQTSAAKTCLLSKAWRYLWCTRPKILFAERYPTTAVAGKKKAALAVLDRTLHGYIDQNLRLQELALRMLYGGDATALLLGKWIPTLTLESFDLSFVLTTASSATIFELPSVVFEFESLRNLSLGGCRVSSTLERVRLKHLQKLCLSHVHISEQVLDNVLSSCPCIEHVSLSDCAGFKTFKATTLKHFQFNDYYNGDVSIEIGDGIPTLRTMDISRCVFSANHDQMLLGFAHLTRLSLTRVLLSSDSFLCGFSCLEELTLDYCYCIKELNLLSSPSMKRLAITNVKRPFKATVDAPSIVSFLYEGILPPSISFAATNSNGWKSSIILSCLPSSTEDALSNWNKMNDLLTALSQSEIYLQLDEISIYWLWKFLHVEDPTLDNSSNIVDAELPFAVEHFTVKESSGSFHSSSADILNCLFHMFRPRFIHMNTCSTKLHRVAEILFKEREMAQCYFWQHVLEGVSMQALYLDGSGCRRPVQYTSLSEFSKKGELRDPCFQLKWR